MLLDTIYMYLNTFNFQAENGQDLKGTKSLVAGSTLMQGDTTSQRINTLRKELLLRTRLLGFCCRHSSILIMSHKSQGANYANSWSLAPNDARGFSVAKLQGSVMK